MHAVVFALHILLFVIHIAVLACATHIGTCVRTIIVLLADVAIS